MKNVMVVLSILLCVVINAFMTSCNDSINPAVEESPTGTTIIRLEIIPDSLLPQNLDSTYYTHDVTWEDRFFDTTAADQFADSLKVFTSITDMWFPNEPSLTLQPMRVGSDVKVKLSKPDTAVERMGLSYTGEGFVEIIKTWRHYKFVHY